MSLVIAFVRLSTVYVAICTAPKFDLLPEHNLSESIVQSLSLHFGDIILAIEFPLPVVAELLEELVEAVVVVSMCVEPATEPVPARLYAVPCPESGVHVPVLPCAAVND